MSDTNTQLTLEQAVDMFSKAVAALAQFGIISQLPGGMPTPAAGVTVPAPVTPSAAVPAASTVALTMPARGQGGRFLPKAKSAQAEAAAPITTIAKKAKIVKEKPLRIPHLVDDFVAFFFKTPQDKLPTCRCGRYEIVKGDKDRADILYFHTQSSNGRVEHANNVIGIRPPSSNIGVFNATRIRYGTSWAEQLRPQVAAEAAGAVPVPFENVVSTENGAGLDLTKLQIVEWRQAENMIIPPVARNRQWTGKFFVTVRHFAGALLLKIEDKYFLFDADREELTHFGFNPFFTQLPGPAATVAEAYDLLIPDEVRMAQAEGRDVRRQGEFFFIPQTDDEFIATLRQCYPNDRSLERTVRRVTDDFEDVGGAHYLWMMADRVNEIQSFIGRCDKYNDCKLPLGNTDSSAAQAATLDDSRYENTQTNIEEAFRKVGRSEIEARIVLQPLLDRYLNFSELSPGALGVTTDGSHNVYTQYLAEVAMIAAAKAEMKRTGKHGSVPSLTWDPRNAATNPESTHCQEIAYGLRSSCATNTGYDGILTMRGNIAQRYGICYQLRIGARSDTRTANAHVATGTALVPVAPVDGEKQSIYAIGAVVHSGREHRPLYLPRWHKVVSNTATANWTVSGAVD